MRPLMTKREAQRLSIEEDGVKMTSLQIEEGKKRYYLYNKGTPYITIEVIESRC